jgi:hypothetical protein
MLFLLSNFFNEYSYSLGKDTNGFHRDRCERWIQAKVCKRTSQNSHRIIFDLIADTSSFSFYIHATGNVYATASTSDTDPIASDNNLHIIRLAKSSSSLWGQLYSNQWSL